MIGVFDSGIGGLTVLQAISKRLPGERLVYFGDTAHVPYGSKSPQAVTRYSVAVAKFLEKKGIELLVIACNTSSAVALSALRKAVKVPVIGVIEPGARAAASGRKVGLIGTEATVASGAYARALGRPLRAQACPLFVPLVEEGWWNHRATTEVAKQYLKGMRGVDTLILGCTHYPLLKKTIAKILPKTRLVDSAEETAKQVEALRGKKKGTGRKDFFVSDDPKRFIKLAKRMGVKARTAGLYRFD
jgi:glutamate racemase